MEISPGAGAGLPLGDFGDAVSAGFAGGADFGYYASPNFAVGVGANYFAFGRTDAFKLFWQFLSGDPNADVKWSETQLTGYGKPLLSPDENTTPYLKTGMGVYSTKLTLTTMGLDVSDSQSDVGLNGEGGVQFRGQGYVGGFVEALFYDILTEGSSTTFSGFRGGVTFFLGGTGR